MVQDYLNQVVKLNLYLLIILVLLYIIQYYNSLRKLNKKDFKCIFYSQRIEELDIELIKGVHKFDKNFRIYELNSNSFIIQRKLSMMSFGYAFLITINNETLDFSFYDNNLVRQLFRIQWYDPIYLLRKDKVLD